MKKLITISLLTSTLLFSATVSEINKEAIGFLNSKNPDKAYELLQSSYIKGDFDNQTLFLLGTSAKQKGDFKNAIKYFEELLSTDKKAVRVKLDLAAAYYQIKNTKKAKELLLEVKATLPPKKVGDNIDRFLAVIDRGIPKAWSVGGSIGYMYDTNVNAGPDTDTILMYNLPFTLSSSAQENDDYAKKYNLNFGYMKRFESFALQSRLNFNMTDYNEFDNLDSLTSSLSVGPTWRDGKLIYSFPIIGSVQKIGHEKKYYSISKGISPQMTYQVGQNFSISMGLSLQEKKYYEASDKDSNTITFSPSSRYIIGESSYISFGGYIGRENSKTETSSNSSMGLNLGYYKALIKNLNMFLSASISNTDYKGIEVAYDKSRDDSLVSVGANISYFIEPIKSNVIFNISYTQNDSNIEMYEYDRTQIGLSFSKSF